MEKFESDIEQRVDTSRKILTKPQLAEVLQVTPRTIEIWCAAGRIPYLKISRTVRFDLEAVMSHLSEI